MQQLNIELPPVSMLFRDQGEAHADFLELVDGVLAELADMGIQVDPRVSYLERRALAKLRRELERRGMTFSDLLPG